ncbi:uncharacterized protein F58A4.6-like [Ornithodoros turicata]|uniref:uncharacterized protein F58A4.6-like n=1 Tax=Ornithodoros turicata TaxID=34597 RepID=UPI0031397E05
MVMSCNHLLRRQKHKMQCGVAVHAVVLTVPSINRVLLVSRDCVLSHEDDFGIIEFIPPTKKCNAMEDNEHRLCKAREWFVFALKDANVCSGLPASSDTSPHEKGSVGCASDASLGKKKSPGQYFTSIDERLFWSMLLELSVSHCYRFLAFKTIEEKCTSSLRQCHFDSQHVVMLQIRVELQQWKAVLDKLWEARIGCVLAEQIEVENAMAWLSTLGGAYSALGDYDAKFAQAASHVSFQQLRLALRIGDPLTLCRCRIYIAMSLLQRGYFKACKKLVREQYEFAKSRTGRGDPRLAKMCQSVWVRMQYLWSLRRSHGHHKQHAASRPERQLAEG